MSVKRTRLVADAVIPADGTDTVIFDAAIDIDADGRIESVSPVNELRDADFDGKVHAVGGLLMPGLVNAHAHTPMILLRSAGDGLPLEQWLTEAVWPREGKLKNDAVHWGQTLGSIEMLRAGVTTTIENYGFEEVILDAGLAVGQRVVMATGILSVFFPEDDRYSKRVQGLADFFDARHDPDARAYAAFGPHSVHDHGPDRLVELATAAADRDALITLHLEETEGERQQVLDKYGKSATQILSDSGVLEGRVLAAHGVWLDDADRAVLGEAGAAVAHCPQSNGKLGSGIADVPAMLDAGITVGLGTDGPASNDSLSLWDELRLAPLFARARSSNPEALDAATALDLATRQGARAIGLDDVGELRAGKWADIIRIDLDQPAFQPGLPGELFNHVVWAASAEHVTDVWVAGEQVVEAGECTKVDRQEAQREVSQRAKALLA